MRSQEFCDTRWSGDGLRTGTSPLPIQHHTHNGNIPSGEDPGKGAWGKDVAGCERRNWHKSTPRIHTHSFSWLSDILHADIHVWTTTPNKNKGALNSILLCKCYCRRMPRFVPILSFWHLFEGQGVPCRFLCTQSYTINTSSDLRTGLDWGWRRVDKHWVLFT